MKYNNEDIIELEAEYYDGDYRPNEYTCRFCFESARWEVDIKQLQSCATLIAWDILT